MVRSLPFPAFSSDEESVVPGMSSTYQCEKGSHITSMNLNPRSSGDRGWKKLMAIVDMLVWAVYYTHLNTWGEAVYHIPNYFSYHKGI
nr:hypothetical protein Iba_chr12cCG23240 [Ipomoea batatas]